MKPLRLYTKTALLISVVVVAVFATAVYLYDSATQVLAREQQKRRAELLATLVSEVIEIQNTGSNIAALRNAVIQFKLTHKDVSEIHIYSLMPGGLHEVLSYPESTRPAMAGLTGILKQQSIYSEIDDTHRPVIVVRAAAPIRSTRGLTGVATIDLEFDESTGLAHDLDRLALSLLGLTVFVITILIYWLFRNIIYKPLEKLLHAMLRLEAGDFNAVAQVKAGDEIGQLSLGFNQMVGRLKEMSEKQKAHEHELEERVQEATAELADRNEQLEAANLQLFDIQRRIAQLERLATAGQLAAQFAHEVGTPLNLISGHVQLLSTRMNDEKSAHRLNIIAGQIERIERIVRHMLDSTRRPKADMKPLNINSLLQKIFEAVQPMLTSRNVTLTTDLAGEVPLIDGDQEQLQQVFLNLINNAIDAMPAGGMLHFGTSSRDESIVIECEDTGEGIPDEVKDRIFDPLFTTKERGQGTGLGLSVARQIIQEHQGRLDFDSKVGYGTKFNISLPISKMGSNEEDLVLTEFVVKGKEENHKDTKSTKVFDLS